MISHAKRAGLYGRQFAEDFFLQMARTNPKYRGPNFNWSTTSFRALCESNTLMHFPHTVKNTTLADLVKIAGDAYDARWSELKADYIKTYGKLPV